MVKVIKAGDSFGQWQVMSEQIERFKQMLLETKRIIVKKDLVVFAVGSPRAFNVVVRTKLKDRTIQKVLHWDIEDGSAEFMLVPFDAVQWHDYEF